MADLETTPLTTLTWCLFVLAGAVDKGLDVPIEEVREHSLDRTLIPWMAEEAFDGKLASQLISLTRPESIQVRADLHMIAEDLVRNGWGRTRMAKTRGVALLIAIFTEAVQQKYPVLAPTE